MKNRQIAVLVAAALVASPYRRSLKVQAEEAAAQAPVARRQAAQRRPGTAGGATDNGMNSETDDAIAIDEHVSDRSGCKERCRHRPGKRD